MANIKKIHISKSEAWILESIPERDSPSRYYIADFDESQQITVRNLIRRKLLRIDRGEKWLLITGRGRRALMEWERDHNDERYTY